MTNPYSELIDQMNANAIAQATLQSILARRQYELLGEIHHLLCVLIAFAVMNASCLLILDVRVFKALDTLAPIEQGNRPIEVHSHVPRFDPAMPEQPNFEKTTPRHYAV
jgi:hypothetical protein